ncbi:MAG: hypothetical protein HC889_08750 [Synechococcaceae cyanobacterium SM1_2_3]|nr:hypothetical protein [Synechococcaceae cyanobacterium SM1_2_3]
MPGQHHKAGLRVGLELVVVLRVDVAEQQADAIIEFLRQHGLLGQAA